MILLDCTLRDGGYYNAWDFDIPLVQAYLEAMQAARVDVVELGFRSLNTNGFKGAFAYSSDEFLSSLNIPSGLKVSVMVNASELVSPDLRLKNLTVLFPGSASNSPVDLVRIACHAHEFEQVLPVSQWLQKKGYQVGYNLMQVADKTHDEIKQLVQQANNYPIDVLYVADSLGSMSPADSRNLVESVKDGWQGAIGIHTHDNQGRALQNALAAAEAGATWIDATVTGMGRGPGNAKMEELLIAVADDLPEQPNLISLLALIRSHFQPMKEHYGWGTNPYYYLAGKYGIHPTYIQSMLADSRYTEEDLLAVIDHLRVEGGKKFSLDTLDAARHFYKSETTGTWNPAELFKGKTVLLLGTGPSVKHYSMALESYIERYQPVVAALNTQQDISAALIDVRVACHPVRLLADCGEHARLPQPLITPASMLPAEVKQALGDKPLLDYGLSVEADTFRFSPESCTAPSSLVAAYALAAIASGGASQILMAGFDGYGADDPRSIEMNQIINAYYSAGGAAPLLAVTPTRYRLPIQSIYSL
ncbi:aldolase catalytic domain-containing protein [Marinobacter sp. F3R11]|uniref:aldolase catalytic domain-containing protein n=1 Tax=Marinobacter sp. F3R11 TaxID=2267231 RepID=UPI000DE837F4|nr:aldolase catalytic domain-containing protein [Marinobacter sp. F3R11]RBW48123.1 aldolase [Marinobacter sp. F3R11]